MLLNTSLPKAEARILNLSTWDGARLMRCKDLPALLVGH
jgi:hypothetical protein